MTKEQSLALLKEHIKNENMVKHCLASGAVMAALARKLGTDVDLWQATGILHDIDVETAAQTGELAQKHCTFARGLLEGKLPPEAIAAIAGFN